MTNEIIKIKNLADNDNNSTLKLLSIKKNINLDGSIVEMQSDNLENYYNTWIYNNQDFTLKLQDKPEYFLTIDIQLEDLVVDQFFKMSKDNNGRNILLCDMQQNNSNEFNFTLRVMKKNIDTPMFHFEIIN